MKKLFTYLTSGIVLIIPVFIIYQIISIVSFVIKPFIDLPIWMSFIFGLLVLIGIGWSFIHIFKNRLKTKVEKLSKNKTWIGTLATLILNAEKISNKAHSAFKNPVLYKVDDGIYKLGFITSQDLSILDNPNSADTEASPSDNSMWIYAPYPINLFGELVLVEARKIKKLDKENTKHLPLFILSGGILSK